MGGCSRIRNFRFCGSNEIQGYVDTILESISRAFLSRPMKHNKAFKYVPGLRPSTEHKTAVQFYAA